MRNKDLNNKNLTCYEDKKKQENNRDYQIEYDIS